MAALNTHEEEAPPEALEILKARPETAARFLETFHYLPEGVDLPEAPPEAVQYLNENPTTAPQFKKAFGYIPAPEEAIKILRDNPETAEQFKATFGYLPKSEIPLLEQVATAFGVWNGKRKEKQLQDQQATAGRITMGVSDSGYMGDNGKWYDAHQPKPQSEQPGIISNSLRAAGERAGDLFGNLLRSGGITLKAVANNPEALKTALAPIPLVGTAVSMVPDNAISEASQAAGAPLDAAGKSLTRLDLNHVPTHTWQKVKQEFSEGGPLSGSSWAEVAKYATEQGIQSIPDMVAVLTALPAYITSTSVEMGANRAKNKGKQDVELTDALEAMPFAVGSALLERIGAKGMTQDVVENVGKDALKEGFLKAATKEGFKAGTKEALTEFGQGILQYVGERFGTKAKMTLEEGFDQALAGAVAGFGMGGAVGGAVHGTISAAAAWDAHLKEKLAEPPTEGQEADTGIPATERRAQPAEGPRERRQEGNQVKREETDSILRQLRATQADIDAGRAAPEAINAIAEKAVAMLYKDDLTGLQNYRSYQEFAKENPDHAVMFMDLDDFKNLNMEYGHGGADQILSEVGKIMRQIGEEMNVVPFRRAKQGAGDEFLAVAADPALLKTYGKRVQEALDSTTLNIKNQKGEDVPPKIGASYGVGVDEAAAEAAGNENKQERKAAGKRIGARDAPADTGAVQSAADTNVPAANTADMASSAGVPGEGSAGDGNSEVIRDDSGSPMVFYHGTDQNFDEFRPTKQKYRESFGEAYFFSNDASKTPAKIAGDGGRIVQAHLAIKNPMRVSDSDGLADPRAERKLIEKAKAAGHDGIIGKTRDGETFAVAFSADQIQQIPEGQPVAGGGAPAANDSGVEGQPVTSEQIQAARPNLPPEQKPSSTAYSGLALDRMGELLVSATHKLMDKLGIAREGIEVQKTSPEDKPGPMSLLWSPSKLVKKYPKLAKYLNFARDSFDVQEGLRNAFRTRLAKIDKILTEGDIFGRMSDAYRQNKRTLKEIRMTEDVLGKRLTAQQMKDDFGARPAVIKAHMLMRATYDHAWTILSKSRELRGKLPPSYREGYLPHMFHNFFVFHETSLPADAMGPPHSEIVGSGRTMAEAIAIANQLRRLGGKGPIKIKAKQFKFPGEDVQAATVGDIEYFQMQRKLENDFTFTPEEAQEIMDALARRKGRSRFFGNLLERKGAPGWERDLDWVDRRYFNMVARYAALDRFKKKATDAYERDFGKFEGDKKDLAQYVKDYINDVNGTPTWIENILNNGLQNTPIAKFLGHYLGDRWILQLANGTANATAIAKLGFLNPAAALINASQLIGAYSVLGEKYFMLGNGLAMKALSGKGEGASTLRGILKQAGVDADLSLASAAGYSSNAPLGKALNMTMFAFTSMEKYVRATTVLGAYRKAKAGGASHAEAIEFARGVNDRVNFNYGIIDTPNFIRRAGPAGTVMFQFKKFPVKGLEFMLSLRRAELARFFIPMFLLAGMYAIPGGEALKELIKAATSRNGYGGWDAELELKSWLTDWAGNDPERQRWAKVVMYGAFSSNPVGVDISKRVGGFDFIPTKLSDLAGAGPSSLWHMVQYGLQGDWAEALRSVATSPGNVAVALSQGKFSTSPTDRDRPIARTSAGDVLKKALGFRPYEEAKEVDVARMIAYDNDKYRNLQREVVDGIISSTLRYNETIAALPPGSPLRKDAQEEYDREIADVVKTIAKNGIVITPEQVENEVKNKNLTRSQRAFLNSSDIIKARNSRIYMFAQGSGLHED